MKRWIYIRTYKNPNNPYVLTACAARSAASSASCTGLGSVKRRDGVTVSVVQLLLSYTASCRIDVFVCISIFLG